MASKKKAVEGAEGTGSGKSVEAATRGGMVIQLSDATKQSIVDAAAEFAEAGLTKAKARDLVEKEIVNLAASVSAIDLYESMLAAKFADRRAAASAQYNPQ